MKMTVTQMIWMNSDLDLGHRLLCDVDFNSKLGLVLQGFEDILIIHVTKFSIISYEDGPQHDIWEIKCLMN